MKIYSLYSCILDYWLKRRQPTKQTPILVVQGFWEQNWPNTKPSSQSKLFETGRFAIAVSWGAVGNWRTSKLNETSSGLLKKFEDYVSQLKFWTTFKQHGLPYFVDSENYAFHMRIIRHTYRWNTQPLLLGLPPGNWWHQGTQRRHLTNKKAGRSRWNLGTS